MTKLDLSKIDLGSFGITEQQDDLAGQEGQMLQANMSEAIKVNPDQHAKTTNLSRESGVPEFAVQSDPVDVENKLKLDNIDFSTMSKRNPTTAGFYTDFNKAAIAHDEIDLMSEIEDIFNVSKTFQSIGESVRLGFEAQAKGGLAIAIDTSSDRIENIVPAGALPVGLQHLGPMLSRDIANTFGVETDEELTQVKQQAIDNIIDELKIVQEKRKAVTPDDLNILEEGVRAGVESLANMLPGVVLSVATRSGTPLLLTTIGTQTFADSYGGARAEGLSAQEAGLKAGIDAAIEVGTEVLPLKTLESIVTGTTKGLSKKALKFAVQEMGTEQLATLGQSLNDFAFGLDEQMEQATSVEEMVQIQLRRQAVTAIATVVAGGAQAAAATGINKTLEAIDSHEQAKLTQDEIDQQTIDTMNDVTGDSKTRQRDIEIFKQFVQDSDGENNTHVFIDSAQAALYLGDRPQRDIEADPALKMLSDSVEAASIAGEDVSIPVEDFASTITGTEHFTNLRDFMTLNSETVAPFRQEQQQRETQQYVTALLDEAEDNASDFIQAQEIFTTVRDQLIDTGQVSPQAASTMAQIVPAWATVHAQKNGISVEQAYADTGLIIEGPLTGERERLEGERELLEQPAFRDAPIVFENVKNDFLDVFEEDASIDEVMDSIDEFPTDQQRLLRALNKADFLGFDFPSQAISAVFSEDIDQFEVSPGIKSALGRLVNQRFEQQQLEQQEVAEPLEQKQPDGKPKTRGFYDPQNSIIRLTESADLSTFLHEFAHFMYEMELTTDSDTIVSVNGWYKRNDEAVAKEAMSNEPGTTITAKDVNVFLDNNTTGDAKKDMGIRRAVHEQFARGFETYVMEGKAPSIELRNAFRTFARWLGQIYRALRGDLNVTLDDEMRQVFDRLLATDEQIAAAQARSRYEPLFTDAAMAGMTEEQFESYQANQEKMKEKSTETLRDQLINEITRQTKKWWKDEKADVIDEVTINLLNKPVYRASTALKSGDVIKLDHATVKDMVGEVKTDKRGRKSVVIPSRLRGMTAKGQKGVHPEEAAAFFGFNSGSEMLTAITTEPTLKVAAEAQAEAIMRERHGDIMNDGTIEQRADEAVANEERGKLILQELKALARDTTQVSLDRQTIKAIAKERIGKLSFRQIHPGKYRKAEIAAAQEAARMLAEGNREGAARAKARQVTNYYLGLEANEAKNETIKIVDRMGRYNKKTVREAIIRAENGYWDQLIKILRRFEFRKTATLKSVDEANQDINSWSRERMEIDGDALVLTPAILDESFVTHWKNVPFSDLTGISDSVKNIEHVARFANKITVEQEQIDFKKLVTQWTNHIKEQDQRFATKSTRSRVDDAREASTVETLRRWASQLSKMPFVASWLDGGERVGMSHQILNQRFTDALSTKLNMMDDAARPVFDAIMNRSAEDLKRHNRKIYIPEIGDSLMGHQILAVALNTGNESNLRKLLLGEQWAEPENDATINIDNVKLQAVLAHMNKSDWQMVQLIWDQMETLFPQLAEIHRRTTGLTPPKIEATPIENEFGVFRGGYYPIKYSRKRSHQAEKNAEKADAETESLFNNTASIQASVNTGVTNERTGFYDAIHLSLDVVPDHFNEVIHYITHHDPVRQVNRLIRNNEVADAITGSLGEAEFNQMKTWLNNIAKDGRQQPVKTYIDEIFQRLRFGTTLSIMGFKVSTGYMQLFGIMTTSAELGLGPTLKGIYTTVGRSWYMKAVRRVLGSTDDMQSAWDFAAERSKIMKHRVTTMDREIRNAMDRLTKPKLVSDTKLGKVLGVVDKVPYLKTIQEVSMKHIALIQTYMVDLPSWIAAYDKSISEFNDEAKAVQFADFIVESTQGSGATKDMSTLLQNQNKVVSSLTMFMTFFSSLGALSRDVIKGARKGVYSPTTVAAKIMFLFALPVFFDMLIRGDLDEPEDEDDRLSKFATGVALYPIQAVPFVRDVASGLIGDYGYNPSPVLSTLEKGIAGFKQISERSFTDEDFTKTALKNAVKLTGAVLGIPGTSQTWATSEHLYDVIEEGEDITFRELSFGPKKD